MTDVVRLPLAERLARRTQRAGERVLLRLPRLPWRPILLVAATVTVVVGAIPALRQAAAMAASRAVLFAASPLAPDVTDFDQLSQTTTVVAADGTVLANLTVGGRRVVVDLDDLPPHVPQAILAAEDAHFYEHSGVDPEAVLRAAVHTLLGRTQGGSTITQQLAKVNYTAGERTIFRKLREVLYATGLERRYSKDELLERYLNQVYFGNAAYGIEAAARAYFDVEPAELTPAQAAMLAGKIRAPSRLDPRARPGKVTSRRNQVLENMADQGWLTRDQLAQAKAEPLRLAVRPPPAMVMAPHFVAYVKGEAAGIEALGPDRDTRLSQLHTGGYTIRTTLDTKLFAATEAAVREQLGLYGDPIVATASVEPGDGAIRSLFGGLDFDKTQFGYATRAHRQPGSAFKPFVYLAALRDGIDPRSSFDGTSGRRIGCYGDRPVNNYAGEDAGGRIDVDTAMAHSVNVVFVELGCQTGVRDVVEAATDAGVPEDATEAQGAVFLGGLDRGVSPLTMAAAYATFAARGTYAQPYAIASISDARGRVVYEAQRRTRPAFDPAQVGVLNRALQRVVTEGTGRAAAIGRPVAGKTGTTQGNVDAWFAGYVPQLATAVWTGYEPRRPMRDVHGRTVTGGSFPAAIFGSLMRAGLEGVPVKGIPTTDPATLGLRILNAEPPPPAPAPLPPPLPAESTTTSTTPTSTLPPGVPPATTPSTPPATGPDPQTTSTTSRKRPDSSTTTTTTSPPLTTSTTAATTSTTPTA